MMPTAPLQVCAAILERRGRIFLARRAVGKHMAGHWEFPGGKIEPGETPQACLAREMQEEFGIAVAVGDHFMTTIHHYPDRVITLLAWRVRHLRGRFRPTSHDRIAFVPRRELLCYALATADIPIAIRLGAATPGSV